MGKKLGIKLLENPDLALEVKNAIPILFIGMSEGIFHRQEIRRLFQHDERGLGPGAADYQWSRQSSIDRRLRAPLLRSHQLHNVIET